MEQNQEVFASEIDAFINAFRTIGDGAFVAELICYNIDQLEEETRRQLTQSICDGIEGVKAFQV